MKTPNLPRMLLAAMATVALVGLLAACGGDDDSNESAAGNGTDAAFIEGMVPHHESAIEMAKIAQEHGQSEFVKRIADEIVSAQEGEIAVMEKMQDDLVEGGVEPEDMGMSDDMMGMDMDSSMLESADPFDREFVDMMIPHHQGAIRMARIELEQGKSPALKELAEDVVAAQTREINDMNAFRRAAFGAESPAGGVPPANESDDSMAGMDHN